MKISTLRKEQRRPFRLVFTHYLVEKYGMNVQTAYGKLRKMAVRRWEAEGIRKCILGFDPGYTGKPENFWDSLEDKKAFVCYMGERMEMGACTVEKRFGNFDFTPLEVKGFDEAYEECLAELEKEEG